MLTNTTFVSTLATPSNKANGVDWCKVDSWPEWKRVSDISCGPLTLIIKTCQGKAPCVTPNDVTWHGFCCISLPRFGIGIAYLKWKKQFSNTVRIGDYIKYKPMNEWSLWMKSIQLLKVVDELIGDDELIAADRKLW